MCNNPVVYKKGWLARRVKDAAKEYNSWPESIKEALKLNTGEPHV